MWGAHVVVRHALVGPRLLQVAPQAADRRVRGARLLDRQHHLDAVPILRRARVQHDQRAHARWHRRPGRQPHRTRCGGGVEGNRLGPRALEHAPCGRSRLCAAARKPRTAAARAGTRRARSMGGPCSAAAAAEAQPGGAVSGRGARLAGRRLGARARAREASGTARSRSGRRATSATAAGTRGARGVRRAGCAGQGRCGG